jgi:hypothetical protein
VLRRIFGLKKDDVMGDWRKLHNEELHCVCIFVYCVSFDRCVILCDVCCVLL